MKNKTILSFTDGYSITNTLYDSCEEARFAMKEQYEEKLPEEFVEDFEDMSGCYEDSAILYKNGEDVFVWSIFVIPEEPKI